MTIMITMTLEGHLPNQPRSRSHHDITQSIQTVPRPGFTTLNTCTIASTYDSDNTIVITMIMQLS